eukprot:1210045-Pleurochrysis_carterae.AAC.3
MSGWLAKAEALLEQADKKAGEKIELVKERARNHQSLGGARGLAAEPPAPATQLIESLGTGNKLQVATPSGKAEAGGAVGAETDGPERGARGTTAAAEASAGGGKVAGDGGGGRVAGGSTGGSGGAGGRDSSAVAANCGGSGGTRASFAEHALAQAKAEAAELRLELEQARSIMHA